MAAEFFSAIENRRSIYGISKETVVSDERTQEIIEFAVKHTPSAFNSQSARAVVVLGEQHDKLWDLTKETLRAIVPAENFSPTEEKMTGFKSGYGTVLFFEDQHVVREFQEKFAFYADNFPIWSQQSSGMLQFAIWSGLESEGFGASLQHYNPLIDEQVKEEWDVPENWKLIAQMPFGKPTASPAEKQYQSLESRVKVYK